MCQGFSHFPGFLHTFVLAKLVISSIRVNPFMPGAFLVILYYKNFENKFAIIQNQLND